LYLNWLGLVFQGGFGSGPKTTDSPAMGSTLLWDRAGQLVLVMAIILSLWSVLIVLIGLRNPTAPAEPQSAVGTTITTK
jgi:hypothetical protein